MIDIKELRIGNWIWSDDINMPYQLIDFGMVVVQRSFENCSPINITNEILEKCGFVEIDSFDGGTMDTLQLGKFNIQTSCYIDSVPWINIYFPNGDGSNTHLQKEIKYLHQLQNIYFYLTGLELDINF